MKLGNVGDSMQIEFGLSRIPDTFQLRGKAGTYNSCGSALVVVHYDGAVYLMPATRSNLQIARNEFEEDKSLYVPLSDGISMPQDKELKELWQVLLKRARENEWR